ncbi:hypothetical protein LSH36_449g00026 [Paralvinella palmiformis]|uniref:Uncharacterized protein n=1 Tax=Paralvinella palmiformis TaxID=53620 RepID=A0AAD9JAY5_9ANNE|nr:hypothetical protein LSH36_449g00026 [Paralvinella palmiformis]
MDQEESSERYTNLLKIIQPMKSEMGDDKEFVTGVMKTLRDGPVKCSKNSSRADCDKLYVKFKVDYVTRAEFPLKIGDKFIFRLPSRHPSSPTALSATLFECCERSMSELCNYLQYAQRLFVNDEENSRSSRFLIELTSCSAIWRCLANAANMSDNYLESLMNFILETEKNAKDLHRRMTVIFRILVNSQLFHPRNSCLRRFYTRTCNNDIDDSFSLLHIIRLMLRYTPENAAKLVVLIQNIVDSRLPHCSLDGFLLTCLREMSKAISSDSKYLPWSDLPLVPSSDELLISPEEDFANLRPVKLKHPYECCEDYFDTSVCECNIKSIPQWSILQYLLLIHMIQLENVTMYNYETIHDFMSP